LFHAVSSFNNAGFALWSDSLVRYVSDPWVCLPVCAAIIIGGLGFPVLFEVRRRSGRPGNWSTHTRLTVWTTVVLLLVGTAAVAVLEWTNDRTIGGLTVPAKLLAAFFQGVQPRTAGFNTLDYAAMREETWFVTDGLMFIGGGSASTAGGIKVTTFALLAFVIWAELRGDNDVTIGPRRIATETQRRALAIALLAVAVVGLATMAIMATSAFPLTQALFEAVSAFATVGLTTGITASLPEPAQVVLVAVMFIGRVGTVSAASALALRASHRLYRLPEARPMVG
jgi:Trk-type K+ transport system membrane component